jgi:uncharacterized protein YbaR (Trm112 family)
MADQPPKLEPWLLELLVDPVSGQPLRLLERDGRWLLHCDATGKSYRIDPPDIPVLLPSEAEG